MSAKKINLENKKININNLNELGLDADIQDKIEHTIRHIALEQNVDIESIEIDGVTELDCGRVELFFRKLWAKIKNSVLCIYYKFKK